MPNVVYSFTNFSLDNYVNEQEMIEWPSQEMLASYTKEELYNLRVQTIEWWNNPKKEQLRTLGVTITLNNG